MLSLKNVTKEVSSLFEEESSLSRQDRDDLSSKTSIKEKILFDLKHKKGINIYPTQYSELIDRICDDQNLGEIAKYYSNDKDIIIECVKRNIDMLSHASKKLRDDKEVILKAVKNSGYALVYASDRLKDDEEVVLVAIENHFPAINFASERLQDKLG